MQTSSLYLSRKSIRIRHHDDLFTRCSRREGSIIEDYHGGASVMVPFDWESEPGTPKVKSREIPTLPPLTPPPSYFYSTPTRSVKNHSKPKLLDNFFTKRSSSTSKTRVQVSPASSLSSSSSACSSRSSSPWRRSYSVPSSPTRASNLYAQNELSRARFSNSRADHEEGHEYESSVSTPCFGRGPSTCRPRGSCSTMLKVLLRDQ
ncbi:hypothetical protein PTKIN_Ptkin03bG0002700 [Pterospermum kingtungense]